MSIQDYEALEAPYLESFNVFLSCLPEQINNLRPIMWTERQPMGIGQMQMGTHIELHMKFKEIAKPDFPPMLTMTLQNSYHGSLYVDLYIGVTTKTGEIYETVIENITLGMVPIMVGSTACHTPNTEDSGFFIVQGQPKVLITQERHIHNIPYVYTAPLVKLTQYVAEVRSMRHPARTEFAYNKPSVLFNIKMTCASLRAVEPIMCTMAYFSLEISLWVLLLVLGIESVLQVESMIVEQDSSFTEENRRAYMRDCLLTTAQQAGSVQTYDLAVAVLQNSMANSTKRTRTAPRQTESIDLLHANVFPHLGLNVQLKRHFIVQMTTMLLTATYDGVIPEVHQRDNMCNKRFDPPGQLMLVQVRNGIHRCRAFIERNLSKTMSCKSNMSKV